MKLDIPLAIIQNDDLLLFQRRIKKPYRNLLGLLGGKKKKGEDLATALKTHFFEEEREKIKKNGAEYRRGV